MKIFIINLKRSKERKELMQKQFDSVDESIKKDFEVIFFEAIDAKAGEHLRFNQYSKIASLLFRGKEMSDGERACFASHYSLWQECATLNEPIVVIEDDMVVLESFWEQLRHISQNEYVYVRLMFLEHKVKTMILPNDFYITFNMTTGTQGYYLTPIGAKAFMASAKCWYRPVDDYMGMFYIHHIPTICVKPVLEEIEMESTIAGR
ncbi:MAG: glycosyltransferase family 25 protein, partial [Helicobacter sp.]|uniref:glycosyltransferase family 25 protein n=1 Tax=Helicobacter sp. TaxID=218 RepID=UPI0025BF7091